MHQSPHDRYADELRSAKLHLTAAGRAWFAAAHGALDAPGVAAMAFSRAGTFDGSDDSAHGWRFPARRGQRLTIDVAFGFGPVFIDLFSAADADRLASAPAGSSRLVYEVKADQDVVARIQPELRRSGSFHLIQRSEATLGFPVQGVTPRAVGGTFGQPRDAGRRRHEGVDIFAPRGTPVVAVADGWVTPHTRNALGGNVVWLWSLTPRVAVYYAHLDRHAVTPGEWVREGEIVGYVGNTGNARSTSPHLHFGVYTPPSGAVDPLPFVCDAPCGERLLHASGPSRSARKPE
jgi:murein DD-endopeptidase MepM/ murein hydrolase activator NlpD